MNFNVRLTEIFNSEFLSISDRDLFLFTANAKNCLKFRFLFFKKETTKNIKKCLLFTANPRHDRERALSKGLGAGLRGCCVAFMSLSEHVHTAVQL